MKTWTNDYPYIRNNSGEKIAKVSGSNEDAKLIAAAPEMLEALSFIQKWQSMNVKNTLPAQLHEAINVAIHKATA